MRQLVHLLVDALLFVEQWVRGLLCVGGVLQLVLRLQHGAGLEVDRPLVYLCPSQTLYEVLANFFNELPRVIGALQSLDLHETDDFAPLGPAESLAVLVICVEALDLDAERPHLNRPQAIVLAEAALDLATLWVEEALSLVLRQRAVVCDVARVLFEHENLHETGHFRSVPPGSHNLGLRRFLVAIFWRGLMGALSLEPGQVLLIVRVFVYEGEQLFELVILR